MKSEIKRRNGRNIIVLSHGCQSFSIECDVEEIESLEWMKKQIDNAIQSAYNEAYNQAIEELAKFDYEQYAEWIRQKTGLYPNPASGFFLLKEESLKLKKSRPI